MKKILLYLALLPLPAAAQGIGISPPGDNDLTMSLLRNIFGEWGGSTLAPAIGTALGVFNAGALFIAGIVFAYFAIAGTVASAHDGEVLGKKWSTLWVPARLAGAVTMLFPTASGYSIGQLFVLWIAAQGVGLANATWSAAAESFLTTQGSIVSVRMNEARQLEPTMRSVLLAEMCNAQARRAGQPGTIDDRSRFSATGGDRQGRGQLTAYTGGEILWNQGECGTLDVRSRNVWDRVAGTLNEAESTMIQAQTHAVLAAAARLRPVAEALISAQFDDVPGPASPEVSAALAAASQSYVDHIKTSTIGLSAAALGYLVDVIAKDTRSADRDGNGNGWITAGTWYYQMARVNSEVARSVAWTPVIEGTAAGTMGLSDQWHSYVNALDMSSASYRRPVVQSVGSGGFGNQQGGVPGAFNTGSGTDAVLTAGMKAFGFNPENSDHPILQMKREGDTIMAGVETALVVAGVGSAIKEIGGLFSPVGRAASLATEVASSFRSKFAGVGKSLAGPLSAASAIIGAALMALFVFGVVLSLYLPLVPFIHWIKGVVSYFLTLFLNVIAMPIWMVAMVHPDGDELGKYGRHGAQFVIDVALRPVLMTIGLAGAMIVLPPVLSILFGMYQNAWGSMQADSVSGLISWIVGIAVYSGLCIVIMHKVFGLIQLTPDLILHWIGGKAAIQQ